MRTPNTRQLLAPCLVLTLLLGGAGLARGTVLVELDALGLPLGPLPVWTNTGAEVGDFNAEFDVPLVTEVGGVHAVTLDGENDWYVGPTASYSVTGDGARSIEAWVYNPALADEETIFAWGSRGGPAGSNMSFNHGSNPLYGAVGHWDAPDIGWAGDARAGQWTFVAYTYDPTILTTSVYTDGVLSNSEVSGPLFTWDIDENGILLPFVVGAQNNSNGTRNADLEGSLSIGRLRVYDEALVAQVIRAHYAGEAADFGIVDADGDGMPNWFEEQYAFLDPANPNDGAADQDGDGLSNRDEYDAGTDLEDPDTDDDGLTDGQEMDRGSSPFTADTDQDGLRDLVETNTGTLAGPDDTGSDPTQADTDGDTFIDGQEIFHGSNPNAAGSVPTLDPPAVLVNLDATGLPLGPLPEWENQGAMGGVFTAETSVPAVVAGLGGARGVAFDGSTDWYVGPSSPLFVCGGNSRSIDAWVLNPVIADEETVFAWGRRGGGDGTNMSFNHGANDAFGAVGHWGGPDIGWADAEVAGQWTHIAYVYDASFNQTCVYTDGQLTQCEDLASFGIQLNTWAQDVNGDALPFVVANQNEAGGTRVTGLSGALTIARVRVYDGPLDAAFIESTFVNEAAGFGIGDPDEDGLPTWYETLYPFLDPADGTDAGEDFDGDGLTNLAEFQLGTLPDDADTDGDTLADGAEVSTSPLHWDSDADGLHDGLEKGTGVFVDATNPGSNPTLADTDGDTFADGQEAFRGSDPNNAGIQPVLTEPLLLVDLDATDLELGPLVEWANDGLIGGTFVAELGVPAVAEGLNDVRGVVLNGTDGWYVGPQAPVFVAGTNSRSIEAWIFNPTIASEETVFAWGRRGGGDGTNMSFNHGTHDAWGAVGHWGNDGDVGWDPNWTDGDAGTTGQEKAGVWTYIVYTYNADTWQTCVYTDGQLTKCESHGFAMNTWAVDTQSRPLRFVVGNQNQDSGVRVSGLSGSMTVARVRVHDRVLTPEAIAQTYAAEEGVFSGAALPPDIESILYNPAGQTVTITWDGAAGQTYAVDYSTDLVNWFQIQGGIAADTFTDAAGLQHHRFYRVRLEN